MALALAVIVIKICDTTGFGRTPFYSKLEGKSEEGDRDQNDRGEGEGSRSTSPWNFHKIILEALRAVEKKRSSLCSASNFAQASEEGECAQELDKAGH